MCVFELIFMTLWWVWKWSVTITSIGGIQNTSRVYSGACEVCSGEMVLSYLLSHWVLLVIGYILGDTLFFVSLPWLNLSPVSFAFTSHLYELSMFKMSWKTRIVSLGSLGWCNEVFLLMFQQWIFLNEKRLLLKPLELFFFLNEFVSN